MSVSPPASPVKRSWALEVGSDAMQDRVHSLLAYQKLRANVPRKKVRNLAVKEGEKTEEEKEEASNLDMLQHGCSLEGLRLAEGIAEYLAAVEPTRRRKQAVTAELQLFEERPIKPICAVLPEWHPRDAARQALEDDAAKMLALFKRQNALKRRRVARETRVRSRLQRRGPASITPFEYAKHLAKAEGLSIDEWCKQLEARDSEAGERERQRLLQERRRVKEAIKDPRPSQAELDASQRRLVAERRGVEAATTAAARAREMRRRWRRLRNTCTATTLALLRWQGYARLYVEHDALFVEADVVLGTTVFIAKDKERLLELEVTHIVLIEPFTVADDDVDFPSDFVYCRLRVDDTETQAQDVLKHEFDMGRRFMSGALRIGGRIVVACPDGTNRAPALIAAFLMWERDLDLKTAYRLLNLHEPDVRFSRSIALFLSLLELELRLSSSLKGILELQSPTHYTVCKHLDVPKFKPYPTPVLFAKGRLVIPDPYSFWFGKPRPPGKRSRCRLWCCCCLP